MELILSNPRICSFASVWHSYARFTLRENLGGTLRAPVHGCTQEARCGSDRKVCRFVTTLQPPRVLPNDMRISGNGAQVNQWCKACKPTCT